MPTFRDPSAGASHSSSSIKSCSCRSKPLNLAALSSRVWKWGGVALLALTGCLFSWLFYEGSAIFASWFLLLRCRVWSVCLSALTLFIFQQDYSLLLQCCLHRSATAPIILWQTLLTLLLWIFIFLVQSWQSLQLSFFKTARTDRLSVQMTVSAGCSSIQYSALSMATPSAPKEEHISPAAKLSLSSINQMQGGCLSSFFLASKEGHVFQIPINSSFFKWFALKSGYVRYVNWFITYL